MMVDIEDGRGRGIDWSSPRLKTFFCSEGFTEEWRDYVANLIPGCIPEKHLLSTYGSSELLLMGYETPETILMRKSLSKKTKDSEFLFSTKSVPSLFQYDPRLRYIEESGGELLFTSRGTIPLIRYNIHDSGKVMPISFLRKNIGLAALKSLRPRWSLPLVALNGRSDMTLVFHAVNIYPDQVHHALNHARYLSTCTGRFKLDKQYSNGMKTRFLVHVELRDNAHQNTRLKKNIEDTIASVLLRENLEYRDASLKLGNVAMRPHVKFHQYADPDYFPAGLKPRYIASI